MNADAVSRVRAETDGGKPLISFIKLISSVLRFCRLPIDCGKVFIMLLAPVRARSRFGLGFRV